MTGRTIARDGWQDRQAEMPDPHQEEQGAPKCPLRTLLGFDSYVANPPDDVVSRLAAIFHGEHFDRVSLVLRAED
jgi:hypothetical protein